jgi:hypothetical protein
LSSDPHDIVYRINSRDELIFVSPSWTDFALANDAPELVPDRVLGRRLWEFINDETTASLYREIVDQAHSGREISVRFRCDAPGHRRRMEMAIKRSRAAEIEFTSKTISLEDRQPVELLDATLPRIGGLLRICGWCKRIDAGDGSWSEIDDAADTFTLFERSSLPPLSHGMCEACFHEVSNGIHQKR